MLQLSHKLFLHHRHIFQSLFSVGVPVDQLDEFESFIDVTQMCVRTQTAMLQSAFLFISGISDLYFHKTGPNSETLKAPTLISQVPHFINVSIAWLISSGLTLRV